MSSNRDIIHAIIFGGSAGMVRYIHLYLMFDTTALTRMIEPAITAAVCAFAAMLGKEMYRWVKSAYIKFFIPWYQKFLKRK